MPQNSSQRQGALFGLAVDRIDLEAGPLRVDQQLPRTYAHVIRQDEDRVRVIVDVTLGGDAGDRVRTYERTLAIA